MKSGPSGSRGRQTRTGWSRSPTASCPCFRATGMLQKRPRQAAVAFAFGSGQVRHVRAHTFPTLNASTRVLAKCGFTRSGEVDGY